MSLSVQVRHILGTNLRWETIPCHSWLVHVCKRLSTSLIIGHFVIRGVTPFYVNERHHILLVLSISATWLYPSTYFVSADHSWATLSAVHRPETVFLAWAISWWLIECWLAVTLIQSRMLSCHYKVLVESTSVRVHIHQLRSLSVATGLDLSSARPCVVLNVMSRNLRGSSVLSLVFVLNTASFNLRMWAD